MKLEEKLDYGVMNSEIIENNGEKIFKKNIGSLSKSFLKKIEGSIFEKLTKDIPFNRCRDVNASYSKLLKREAKTSEYWNEEGIKNPELKSFNSDTIYFDYIQNSESLKQYFNRKDSAKVFDKFLDVYDSIRNLAFKKNDKKYFHSDPHLGNFIIENEDNILPIDSGCVLDKNMSLNELDFHLLRQTMGSISSLNINDKTKIEYVKKFIGIMDNEKKEMFSSYDYSMSPLTKAYFGFRDFVSFKMSGNKNISNLKKYENFVDFFNSNIRNILKK